ncbi:hypothetical protein [Elstera cyanobacteriorum]|uniref:Uncharacterized protein n=1 Tax=Elstera cyanobacteriorum TaxID=2022747 RepID=A0A255XX92_9PROT|nr:hypothetical protein [Elstera cyanobacteriorum]MCK6443807.1 hypothetical protein [Elstera cyanobacteriorum]OYQ21005.1 hypothetical protein CHR90_03485 [Elstera cyanobacteriorum]GFZ98094.1 hypothetical protein GCM10011497_31000 [Elstera cyanobacteriorum]
MTDDALLAEIRNLTQAIRDLQGEVRRSACMVASAQLIAVDASRSEVYATLMDDSLLETTERLTKHLAAQA